MGVRLHPIRTGEIRLGGHGPRLPRRGPAKLPRALLRNTFREADWYPVPAYLLEHSTEGPVLVDVGYDPSVADDPTRTLGRLFGAIAMKHRLGTPALDQVTERGLDPAEISTVVMTHLHLDHTSAVGQWPNATFVVDRAERKAAAVPVPGPYVRSNLARVESWREIDYEAAAAEPFESFAKTVDLFGDGSVRLISSPGHSPGHQSVLVELGDRFALLCGDAAISTAELHQPVVDGLIVDQDAYIRSGDEAREFVRSHPDTLGIPSHDKALWERLEVVYE